MAISPVEQDEAPDITDCSVSDDGEIFLVDNDNHRVAIRDNETGQLTFMGRFGRGLGQLRRPFMVCVAPDGDAYVTINGVGAPGSGEVVMFAGLTTQAEAPPSPETLPVTGGERAAGVVGQILASIAFGLALAASGLLLKRGKPWTRARR